MSHTLVLARQRLEICTRVLDRACEMRRNSNLRRTRGCCGTPLCSFPFSSCDFQSVHPDFRHLFRSDGKVGCEAPSRSRHLELYCQVLQLLRHLRKAGSSTWRQAEAPATSALATSPAKNATPNLASTMMSAGEVQRGWACADSSRLNETAIPDPRTEVTQ